MLIGRNKEVTELISLFHSQKSEFVAIYGRRRVGKTFLIRETFQYNLTFQHTGILDAPMNEQLAEFRESLYAAGLKKCAMPKNWHEAFHLLQRLIEESKSEKKVVFIDELPWMDTPKSNFVRALDHFWNAWASARKDVLLIICGSATSWIIKKIIRNYGGLHNRLTRQIFLRPFALSECEQYCKSEKLGFTRRQIMEAYMIFGGVPYYWSLLQKNQSLAQNIDRLFFAEDGELRYEFDALYSSLFRHPEPYIAVITSLSQKKQGMLREEILEKTQISDNSIFSTVIAELEQCGFIRKYTCLGKKRKSALFQIIDNYTLFYFQFILANTNHNCHFWSSQQNSPTHNIWAGLAFERVCLQHIDQIKAALGFSAVISNVFSWTYKPKNPMERGTQIDLLIDRNDQTINLCEMKYTKTPYLIDKEEDERLHNRLGTFQRESKTNKTILLTMITSNGLVSGGYSDDIPCQLTMDALFLD